MSFIKYLNQFTKDTEKMQTHLSLNGGKYNVPDDQYNEFYKRYYTALKEEDQNLFLVEKVTDSKFAFFIDLDVPKKSTFKLSDTNFFSLFLNSEDSFSPFACKYILRLYSCSFCPLKPIAKTL